MPYWILGSLHVESTHRKVVCLVEIWAGRDLRSRDMQDHFRRKMVCFSDQRRPWNAEEASKMRLECTHDQNHENTKTSQRPRVKMSQGHFWDLEKKVYTCPSLSQLLPLYVLFVSKPVENLNPASHRPSHVPGNNFSRNRMCSVHSVRILGPAARCNTLSMPGQRLETSLTRDLT